MDDRLNPAADEFEVSVFGPGFGECIVVHLGDGAWLINDSCVVARGSRPVALDYLSRLGVDVASAVKVVVASHWHDDHIRGLAEIVRACPAAKFVCSSSLRRREFMQLVRVAESGRPTQLGSGVSELRAIMDILSSSSPQRIPVFAQANQVLWRRADGSVAVWALSPSHAAVLASLQDMASLTQATAKNRFRLPQNTPNRSSVVIWLDFTTCRILLGGDLETQQDPTMGWRAIVASQERPAGTADTFKVAHHGSQNAHLDEIWSELLNAKARSVVTPWRLGGDKLPRQADIARIVGLSAEAYITNPHTESKSPARPPLTTDLIQRSTKNLVTIGTPGGHVRLRKKSSDVDWTVALFDGAADLAAS